MLFINHTPWRFLMATKLSPSLVRTGYKGKHPLRIYSVGMSGKDVLVTTNNGERWLLTAAECKGKLPDVNEDISKYINNPAS
jgi:hypothetical protein